jgi:hypothetical protein
VAGADNALTRRQQAVDVLALHLFGIANGEPGAPTDTA